MKKPIRMRMTPDMAKKIGYQPQHGGLFIGPVDVDIDTMTPIARWIAEHITATYIVDDVEDQIPIIAQAGFSRADLDRQNGVTEDRIEHLHHCYGEIYTSPIEITPTFPILSARERPEDVIEQTARELAANGAARLYDRESGDEYIIRATVHMTNEQFSTCVAETQNYSDRDAYISDLSLSSMWGDAEDAPVPEQRIADLGQIWDAAHRTFRDIAAAAGTSVRQLAMRYAIPRRTAENWSSGENAPQLHELLAIQQCEGLLTVRRD